MTAQRIPSIIFQSFYPGNNLPLNGGKVTTWKAGTTGDSNLQTTWSDAEQNAENTNPVILDANGKANIFGGPNAYHILVQDKDGNTIDDQDNVFFGTPNQIQTTVASLADLKALPFGQYQLVFTEYRVVQGDGGGGDWDWVPDATTEDDDILVVAPNSLPESGRFIRRYAGKVDCRWGGVADNAESINANLTSLFAAVGNRTIWFPRSPEGSGQYASTENFVFPSEASIDVDDGAFFSVDVDTTFDLSSVIGLSHGPHRLFLQSGTVRSPKKIEVMPEWWGAVGNGVTDDYESIYQMLNSLPASVNFDSKSSYAVVGDPLFNSYDIGIIRAAGNVWLTTDHTTIYLKKGIYVASGYVLGNLNVDTLTTRTAYTPSAVDTPGSVSAGTQFFELGRPLALGYWATYVPTIIGGVTAPTGSCVYTVIGKTIIVKFQTQFTVSGGATGIGISMPAGFTLVTSGIANTQSGSTAYIDRAGTFIPSICAYVSTSVFGTLSNLLINGDLDYAGTFIGQIN